MADLKSVVAYLCKNYPHQQELSKARLTKMVYLADWFNAVASGSPITDIDWEFNHYGPYVEDVATLARTDPDFKVQTERNMFGNARQRIQLMRELEPQLSGGEKEILDFVIEKCRLMYWDDFIKYVYDTYPIKTQPKYSRLDLVALAAAYNDSQELWLAT